MASDPSADEAPVNPTSTGKRPPPTRAEIDAAKITLQDPSFEPYTTKVYVFDKKCYEEVTFPAPKHGRVDPYVVLGPPKRPTPQAKLAKDHFSQLRGNPPAGITPDRWNRMCKKANTFVYKNSPVATRLALCYAARELGWERDLAIEFLIKEEALAEDFDDVNT